MSAIYGVIDLKKGTLSPALGDKIHAGYQHCKIDNHRQTVDSNVVFGAEQQIFTAEDENGAWAAPVYDKENNIIFAGEGILDNREELLTALNAQTDMSDVWLMYLGYLKWGKDCISHYRGIFSFAVYDMNKNEAVLYVDYFANHCMYYFVRDNVLYFSTLVFPIISGSGFKFRQNERWLAECISVRGPGMMFEPRECAYQGVYKIPAGHFITVRRDSVSERCYWNPLKSVKYNPQISDAECREKVRRYVMDSVRSCIRTNGRVAVSLSSGLDSTTIGGMAASILSNKDKKLYSFTSIPLKESNLENKRGIIYDETQGVLDMCGMYPNIEPEFIDCKGKNLLTEAERIVNEWELPCMSQQNGVWIGELRRHAYEKGCRIMLTGAMGNTTISAGKTEEYIMDLARRFRFVKADRDLKTALKKYNFGGRKHFIKYLIKAYTEYYKNFFCRNKDNFYKDTVTRVDMGEKQHLSRRYYQRILGYKPVNTIQALHGETYILKACAQIGEIDTKNCLAYGIMDRDPLRNVELIEFLCTLPMRCFVNAKHERRLVREFMDGIIPDSIRLDEINRGRQSGDNAYRISQSWEDKIDDVRQALFSKESLKYLDDKKINDFLVGLDKDNLVENEMDMRMITDAYTFALFLKKVNQYTYEDTD